MFLERKEIRGRKKQGQDRGRKGDREETDEGHLRVSQNYRETHPVGQDAG